MADETAQQEKRLYPQQWEGIISASLDEDNAELFLSTFEAMIEPQFLPYPQHIQALLYLVIHPPNDTEAALNILYHLLSLHTPAELYQRLPSHSPPSTSKRTLDPQWACWEAKSDLARKVKRAFRPCAVHGIWPLMWQPEPKGDSRMGSRSRTRTSSRAQTEVYDQDEEDEEDEEGSVRRRTISERGWVLLEWLVALWQQEAEDQPLNHSPTFIAQLPQPYSADLPINEMSIALGPIAQAFGEDEGVSDSQRLRRRAMSRSILELLVSCTYGKKPPISASALRSSLIGLIRNLSPESLFLLFCSRERFSEAFQLNLFAHAIEDLAGVRSERTARRRDKGDEDFTSDLGKEWPVPRDEYLLSGLLPLARATSDDQNDDAAGKIRMLVELMLRMRSGGAGHMPMSQTSANSIAEALQSF